MPECELGLPLGGDCPPDRHLTAGKVLLALRGLGGRRGRGGEGGSIVGNCVRNQARQETGYASPWEHPEIKKNT